MENTTHEATPATGHTLPIVDLLTQTALERDTLQAEVERLRSVVERVAWTYEAEQRDMKPILCVSTHGLIPHELGQAARAALAKSEGQ